MSAKRVFISLSISALLFFLSALVLFYVDISYEGDIFKEYAYDIEERKQKVILFSLLTESEFKINQGRTVEEIVNDTKYSFEDNIYSESVGEELGFISAVGRLVFHKVELYFDGKHKKNTNNFYFRSYTDDTMITERPLSGVTDKSKLFDIELCRIDSSCVLFQGLDKSSNDRIVISDPLSLSYYNDEVIKIMSPIYFQDDIVGEFGLEVNLSNIQADGKKLNISIVNGSRYMLLHYPKYPWRVFSYKKTYLVDDDVVIIYEYPFTKTLFDSSGLLLIYILLIFGFFVKLEQSKKQKTKNNVK